MKKFIENGGPLSPYVKKTHVDNFKRLIAQTEKIIEAMRIKGARQTVQTLSYSGRFEGEVRFQLVSHLFRLTFVNEYVTTYCHTL